MTAKLTSPQGTPQIDTAAFFMAQRKQTPIPKVSESQDLQRYVVATYAHYVTMERDREAILTS